MPKRAQERIERIAVSVDWDFFFKEDPMWDWGHKEGLFFLEAIWYPRFKSFALSPRLGEQDLEGFYKPNPMYKGFCGKLQGLGFDFSQAIFVVGDSHIGAWSFLASFPVTHVYNFDWHHDVAYHDLDKTVECGNWLGQLLRRRKRLTATIVYPTKERQAEEFHLPKSVNTLIGDRVQATSLRSLEGAPRKVNYLYICRSGSWTPPWADSQFVKFVAGITNGLMPIWYQELLREENADLANPLVPRNWDRAEALRQTEEYKKYLVERGVLKEEIHGDNDEVQP